MALVPLDLSTGRKLFFSNNIILMMRTEGAVGGGDSLIQSMIPIQEHIFTNRLYPPLCDFS